MTDMDAFDTREWRFGTTITGGNAVITVCPIYLVLPMCTNAHTSSLAFANRQPLTQPRIGFCSVNRSESTRIFVFSPGIRTRRST